MTFLYACGKVSNADEQLFQLGEAASEISKAENIVLKEGKELNMVRFLFKGLIIVINVAVW